MVRQCRKLTAIGVLWASVLSLSASAETPTNGAKASKAAPGHVAKAENKPATKPEKAEAKAEQAEAKAATKTDKVEAKATSKGEKAEAKAEAKTGRLEAKAEKAEARATAKAERAEAKADEPESKTDAKHAGSGLEGKQAGAARRAHAPKFKSAMQELRERYKSGALKKGELEKELQALRESRKERRQQHQLALKERWGASLAAPPVRAELERHERRMAKLNRLSLLAETERQGAAKDKLVQRIDQLTARENERHERKMTDLESTAGSPRPGNPPPTVKASVDLPAGHAATKTGEQK